MRSKKLCWLHFFLVFLLIILPAFSLAQSPYRVVALQSSIADLWLCAGGVLTGVTSDAIERALPVGEATIVGTNKEPSVEAIILLQPDLVLYTPDIVGQMKAAAVLEYAGIKVEAVHIEGFEDYLHYLKEFTDLTGRSDLYKKNGLEVNARINSTIEKYKKYENKPTVLFLRAYSTGVKAKANGHIVCKMLNDLGACNVADSGNEYMENLSIEAIIAKDPEFVLITTMGQNEEATKKYLFDTCFSQPAWSLLKATTTEHILFLPDDLFHYNPNARWDEAYEYLAGILYD